MSRMTVRLFSRAVVAAVMTAAAVPLLAQAPASAPTPRPRPAASATIDAAKLYAARCAMCHGKLGEGTPMGRPLAAPLMNGATVEAVTEILETGIEGTPMVSFAKTLTPAQIAALAKYVAAMKR